MLMSWYDLPPPALVSFWHHRMFSAVLLVWEYWVDDRSKPKKSFNLGGTEAEIILLVIYSVSKNKCTTIH